jgi:hypothetical protein
MKTVFRYKTGTLIRSSLPDVLPDRTSARALRRTSHETQSIFRMNRRIGLLLSTMAKVLEERGRIIENVRGAHKVGV